MTEKELIALGEQWQAKLRLRDWDVQYQFVKPKVLGGSLARITPNLQHKSALVRVKIPKPSDKHGLPIEFVVVHELLHLAFLPFTLELGAGTIAQDVEEQQVNALASALTGHKYTGALNKKEKPMASSTLRNSQQSTQQPADKSPDMAKGGGKVMNSSLGTGSGKVINATTGNGTSKGGDKK